MSDDFLGIGPDAQLAIVGVVGLGLVIAGESMQSSVDAEYDPMVYGIGVVMVLYAVGRFGYERLAS